MKISNSKKQLAKIISENGGWRDGEFAAQDGDGGVGGYGVKPEWDSQAKYWWREALGEWFSVNKINNHHQAALSRAEYFHLYPAPDDDGWIEWKGGECPVENGSLIDVKKTDGSHELAVHDPQDRIWNDKEHRKCIVAYRLHKPEQARPEFCESVMRSIPEPEIHSKNTALTQVDDIDVVESKPTIEQLAADYRNAKDYADRKQQETDAAKADAEARLAELVVAGKALGLVLSVADAVSVEPEPELVIAVQNGDEVECIESNANPNKYRGMTGTVLEVDVDDASTPYLVDFGGEKRIWCHEVKFIRRP